MQLVCTKALLIPPWHLTGALYIPLGPREGVGGQAIQKTCPTSIWGHSRWTCPSSVRPKLSTITQREQKQPQCPPLLRPKAGLCHGPEDLEESVGVITHRPPFMSWRDTAESGGSDGGEPVQVTRHSNTFSWSSSRSIWR